MNFGPIRRSLFNIVSSGAVLAVFGASGLSAGILQNVSLDSRSEQFNVTAAGAQDYEYAGVIDGTYNGFAVTPLFCVDIFTPISVGVVYSANLIAPRVSRNEDRAAWLLNQEIANVNSPVSGAALQLAIWDIVHDGGDGLNAGLVQSGIGTYATPSNVIALATTYLNESVGKSSENATIYVTTTGINTPAQNLISVYVAGTAPVPAVPVSPSTPEPSTWVLACGSLLAIGIGKVKGSFRLSSVRG